MNQVFKYLHTSKQAFHQHLDRQLRRQEQHLLLLPLIIELRREHPGVSARMLYEIMKPQGLGRDLFEQLCFANGLKLARQIAFKKTTDSNGVIRFPNLVALREFTAINQCWVSDITYYEVLGTFYYLTFIMDLFSRRIVGYSVSKKLLTIQTTLPALQMALQARTPGRGLIFHSDGGGQYYCKMFLELTRHGEISNSMGEMAYDNPNAERVNGTIKNQYLKGYGPRSFDELQIMTARAVKNYNEVRPHQSLAKKSPMNFENAVPAGGLHFFKY
jgi:transposase InsO family protein